MNINVKNFAVFNSDADQVKVKSLIKLLNVVNILMIFLIT